MTSVTISELFVLFMASCCDNIPCSVSAEKLFGLDKVSDIDLNDYLVTIQQI